MLEIRYYTDIKKISAWCADPNQFGNLDRGLAGEAVIIMDIEIPYEPPEAYLVDELNNTLIVDPDYRPYIDPDYIRACELLSESAPVITQPEMWELMRIFGKRLGYRFE